MDRATAILFKAKVRFYSWCAIYRVPSLDSLGRSPAAGPHLLMTPEWPGLSLGAQQVLGWAGSIHDHACMARACIKAQARVPISLPVSKQTLLLLPPFTAMYHVYLQQPASFRLHQMPPEHPQKDPSWLSKAKSRRWPVKSQIFWVM